MPETPYRVLNIVTPPGQFINRLFESPEVEQRKLDGTKAMLETPRGREFRQRILSCNSRVEMDVLRVQLEQLNVEKPATGISFMPTLALIHATKALEEGRLSAPAYEVFETCLRGLDYEDHLHFMDVGVRGLDFEIAIAIPPQAPPVIPLQHRLFRNPLAASAAYWRSGLEGMTNPASITRVIASVNTHDDHMKSYYGNRWPHVYGLAYAVRQRLPASLRDRIKGMQFSTPWGNEEQHISVSVKTRFIAMGAVFDLFEAGYGPIPDTKPASIEPAPIAPPMAKRVQPTQLRLSF